jgi:hypothetical protein
MLNFCADILSTLGVSAQPCAAPLPVGETGGSKGKGGGLGGGSPGLHKTKARKAGDTQSHERAKPAIPSAREGQCPLVSLA